MSKKIKNYIKKRKKLQSLKLCQIIIHSVKINYYQIKKLRIIKKIVLILILKAAFKMKRNLNSNQKKRKNIRKRWFLM